MGTINKTKEQFESIVELYLANSGKNGNTNKLELDFGINPDVPQISKQDYDKLIVDLYRVGFEIANKEGEQILYITPDFPEIEGIVVKVSGKDFIEKYCKTDNVGSLRIPVLFSRETVESDTAHCRMNNIKFSKKMMTGLMAGSECTLDVMDYNFRVSYKKSEPLPINDSAVEDLIAGWNTTKKRFQYVNRIKMRHPEFPVIVTVCVCKSSRKNKFGEPIKSTTLLDSRTLREYETYTVSISLDNDRVVSSLKGDVLVAQLRKTVRFILSSLQKTYFPLSYGEQNQLLHEYLMIVFGEKYNERMRISPSNFIGPTLFTLQLENIMPLDETHQSVGGVPNIRSQYAVTDKADGERNLLYVGKSGRIYLISTSMLISFTGLKTPNKDQFNSILDGEYITTNKFGDSVNIFYAFDIYFIGERDVRKLPLYEFEPNGQTPPKEDMRYKLLRKFVAKLTPSYESGVPKNCNMKIETKTFYFAEPNNPDSIFQKSAEVLSTIHNADSYEYNTDGMIYTPMELGVGQKTREDVINNYKKPWDRLFKWKPPQHNTIDFLVDIKKEINVDTVDGGIPRKYKTVVLRCGFNEKTDGYIDPYQDMVDGKMPVPLDYSSKNDDYKPYPFIPISPADPTAQYANIELVGDNEELKTEDGDYFSDKTIVEFRYDFARLPMWRWVPIRVRYDKTYQLLHGQKNYGNNFKTANSNWKSIHYPITEEMITKGGVYIPQVIDDESDTYYNRKQATTLTKSLRDFHNLYVKMRLIVGVALIAGNSNLIDFAVGKAGDIPKWTQAHIQFVLGVDINEDNIKNRLNGACARYLNNKRDKLPHLPQAFFMVGDCSLPFSEGKGPAFQDNTVARIIFGDPEVSFKDVGNGVVRLFEKAKGGFMIGSCQFALHYMFETATKLHTFLGNLATTIAQNGYFIATCFDGQSVFELLQDKKIEYGESYVIRNVSTSAKLFEITRMYKESAFPATNNSVGYAIDIYQESINNVLREYLVHPHFLTEVMELYGFVPCPQEEADRAGIPANSATFGQLFEHMQKESPTKKLAYRTAPNMTPEEKEISFLNRYWIFKKVREVSVPELHKMHIPQAVFDTPKKKPADIDDSGPLLKRLQKVKPFVIEPQNVDFIVTEPNIPLGKSKVPSGTIVLNKKSAKSTK